MSGLLIGLIVHSMGSNELYHGMYTSDGIVISPAPGEVMVPLYCVMQSLSIALIGSAGGARLLSEESLVFYREFNAGHSVIAYFIGKNIMAIYRIVLLALHYSAFLQLLAIPLTPFNNTFVIIFGYYAGVYGIAMLVSLSVRKENAPLVAIMSALLMSVFTGMGPNVKGTWAHILSLFYSRWLAEAQYDQEVSPFNRIYRTDTSADLFGYTMNRFSYDIGKGMEISFANSLHKA